MRILRIGDPHIKPSNIEEADRLMCFVKDCIIGSKKGIPIQRLEILGDLFHTHAVIRLEVLNFWDKWLQIFRDIVETIVLVGNHDQSGDHHSDSHALSVFKRLQNERLRIIDAPTKIGIFGYMPYVHDGQTFLSNVRDLAHSGAKTLVCHTTFAGGMYDNGFYAPDGINPDEVPFETIISGHIHKEQLIAKGKVDYPGTPKWDSISDANERKGIWLYQHDEVTGKTLERHLIPTNHVCTPLLSFTWTEGQEEPTIPENAKVSIELIGSSIWINKQKTSLKGKVSIKTKITDKEKRNERKSGNSLENFLMNLYNTNMDRQELLAYAREIGIV